MADIRGQGFCSNLDQSILEGRRRGRKFNHSPPPVKTSRAEKAYWLESGDDKCQHFVYNYKATISADPILDPTNCTVLAIYEELCQLAFFRLGKDTTWNYVDESWSLIQEVTHFKGKFYAVDFWGQLFAFDITSSTISNVETLVAREGKDWDYARKSYLVSSNEKELLMVRRYFDLGEGGMRMTKKFRIFKLNFDKREWTEENNLSDGALFVDDSSSAYVLASSLSGSCRPNCIHFTHDCDRIHLDFGPYGSAHDFGAYDLENQIVSQPYSALSKALVKKSVQRPIWAVL